MPAAYVPVTPDPASVEGAVAGLGRVWERYGVDRVVLLVSPHARREDVERVAWWAERLLGGGRVERREAPRPGAAGAVERLRGLLGGGEGGVVLVSAASRWLSAALSLAASGLEGYSLVYVSFYFGPWTGLVYPYTPWLLEPLSVLQGPEPRGGWGDGAAAEKAPPAWEAERLLGSLPPLRAAVAEAARRLNIAYSRGCRRLALQLPNGEKAEASLAEPASAEKAVEALSRSVAELSSRRRDGHRLRSLAAFTGVAEVRELGEKLRSARRVIIDTSLIYYGAHIYYWEGVRIAVPECAVWEVERRFAEAVKAGGAGGGADLAAYLGLHDLLDSGAPVVPTPPGACDTALVKADPFLLMGSVLATADDGAHRFWRSHPVCRLGIVEDAVKASFDAWRQSWRGASREPGRLARLYYALHQALVVFTLLAERGALPFSAECAGAEGVEVAGPLREVAGWLGEKLGLGGGGASRWPGCGAARRPS